MTEPRLTTHDYWESTYNKSAQIEPLQVDGFRNYASRKIVEKLEELPIEGARVLEVGAGNSAVLTHLARRHGPNSRFTGLDYSENGCQMLARRAALENVSIEIVQQDLFNPNSAMVGRFDVVYSLGVVEHFHDLSSVLDAKSHFLSPGGQILTVIPNMAGSLGKLTRKFNQKVYDKHFPHDLGSFIEGHRRADLEILSSGYICSSNFGILSSCFTSTADSGWTTYLWLSRVSTAMWFIEDKLTALPHSSFLSPYIFAISRRRS